MRFLIYMFVTLKYEIMNTKYFEEHCLNMKRVINERIDSRYECNKEILIILNDIVEKYPELRFSQILSILQRRYK